VRWDIDILYIEESRGHLHNVGFLSQVGKGGGLKTLKTLAIDDGVGDESRMRHSHERFFFQRYSPSAVVQQLSNLVALIIVGKAEA